MPDEPAAGGVADGVASTVPSSTQAASVGELLRGELAERDRRTGPSARCGYSAPWPSARAIRPDSQPESSSAAASASRTTSSGLGRGQPDRGAGQALRGRGGADRADLVQPRRQQRRRSARSLVYRRVVDRGQRRRASSTPTTCPATTQRDADLGADARDRGQVVRARRRRRRRPPPRPVRNDAADDPRRRRQPVEDLPEAAHRPGSAAVRPDARQHDRQQPAAGEVVDDGLARRSRAVPRASRSRSSRSREAAAQAGASRAAGRILRPGLAGAAEQPALAVVDLHRAQRLELLGALDALGDDPRADLAGERGGGAQDGLAGASRSTPATIPRESLRKSGRMSATYSSEVKPAPASSTATSAPRAIHGRSRSRSRRVVEHRVLLGELDHEPRRQLARQLEQPRVAERLGREVDPQQATVRRDAGGGDRRPAGDLEVVAQAVARRRGGERHVGRQRRRSRAASGSARGPRSRSSRDRVRRTIGWNTARIAPGSSSARKSSAAPIRPCEIGRERPSL